MSGSYEEPLYSEEEILQDMYERAVEEHYALQYAVYRWYYMRGWPTSRCWEWAEEEIGPVPTWEM